MLSIDNASTEISDGITGMRELGSNESDRRSSMRREVRVTMRDENWLKI
jgi:hypothetical protein